MSETRNTENGKMTSRKSRRPWIILLTVLCVLIAVVAGLWNAPSLFVHISSSQSLSPRKVQSERPARTHSRADISPITQSSYVPSTYRSAVSTTAQHYMNALLNQQYTTMWSMLAPDVQARWPNETAFANMWHSRFQHYTLQRFTTGTVKWLPNWVDPETMISYSDVLQLPVSLALQPDQAITQDASAPPEDLHPDPLFQNIPFIVQQDVDTLTHNVRWLVLDAGPADTEAPLLPPIHPTATSVEVPIMMFHHVSDVIPGDILGKSLTVKNTLFQQQLAYLKQHNYHTITMNQLFDALYFGGPLPVHPIILTFDDGYEDVYQFAFPLLKQYNYTGTFNIITGMANTPGYLTWDNIKAMLAGGMQIASHTVHHLDMGQLLLYSKSKAQFEMQQSKATLQQEFGITIQQFCYPSGEPFRSESVTLQQEIVAMLAADGYIGATNDPGQTGDYQSNQRPFDLLRTRVDGRNTLLNFEYSLPW
jgi:peptidoglycan/xylan/chitin deacetylase (PgdA/CDA1 family)